jgi:rhamnosyltransferase
VSVNIFHNPSSVILTPSDVRAVSHVISSGMIVRNSIAKRIGLNREDLFIDWVDTEWCWRACLNGYPIYQTGAVVLSHSLGEDRIRILGKQITRHKLFRSYYKIRNAILIFKTYKNLVIKRHLLSHTIKNIFLVFFSQGTFLAKTLLVARSIRDGVHDQGGSVDFSES